MRLIQRINRLKSSKKVVTMKQTQALNVAALILAVLGNLIPSTAHAACQVLKSQSSRAATTRDPIGLLLSSAAKCPTDVFQFRSLLKQRGMKLETALVANRGFHNPSQGSFSMFEMVTAPESTGILVDAGDFFFGHFTAVSATNELAPDQNAQKGSLMIEAIAWDTTKGFYNFYELIGNGSQGRWFYRGDSADILADNQFLHRQADSKKPVFGNSMRCSACHTGGGPIMKELSAPHNDWWDSARNLDLGGRKPNSRLAGILATLVPADRLAKSVVTGLKKLESSGPYKQIKSSLTLQEQLRPLFCAVEVNFKSDLTSNSENQAEVRVPAEFFVDSRLISPAVKEVVQFGLPIHREDYTQALKKLGSRFPETNRIDGDHAWLTVVKAKSDKVVVDALIAKGIIDEEFAADVLAVDFTNPVFSAPRCSLLRLVPTNSTPDWKSVFIERLSQSHASAAHELLQNLTESSRNLAFYQTQVGDYLKHCSSKLKAVDNVLKLTQLLDQRRNEIRASEISKNPRGQILEPGFRVIFPEFNKPVSPGQLELSKSCDIEESTG